MFQCINYIIYGDTVVTIIVTIGPMTTSGMWTARQMGNNMSYLNYFIIIIIIISKGRQCKAGRERLTPYQFEDPNPTIPTHRMKEEKGKTVGDKKWASS